MVRSKLDHSWAVSIFVLCFNSSIQQPIWHFLAWGLPNVAHMGLQMFTGTIRPDPPVDLMCRDDLMVDLRQKCDQTVDLQSKMKISTITLSSGLLMVYPHKKCNSIIRSRRNLRMSFIRPSLMNFVELDLMSPSILLRWWDFTSGWNKIVVALQEVSIQFNFANRVRANHWSRMSWWSNGGSCSKTWSNALCLLQWKILKHDALLSPWFGQARS